MANIYYDKNIDKGNTDDEEIEALIRQELDALEDNVVELEEDLGLDQPDENIDENEKLEIEAYEKSISQYLDLIKYNQDKVSQNIIASQETLIEKNHDSQPSMDKVFAEKLKKLLEEDDQASDSQTESLIQLREKALVELEQNDFVGEQSENKLIVAVYNPELIESIAKLEEEENEKLQTLLKKQEEEKQLEAKRSKETMEELLAKEKVLDNKIEQRMKDFEKNLETFQETERIISTVDSSKVSFLKEMEDEFQERIKEIDHEKQKEEKEFLNSKAKIEKERARKRLNATVALQKHYRGYRARQMYGPQLAGLKAARQRLQQEKLEQIAAEEEMRKRKEEIKRSEEKERKNREKERSEKEREEKLKLEKAEKRRLEKEKNEREKLEKERLEKLRLEKEREEKLEREKEKSEQIELEKEKEKREKERLEKEKTEKLKLEKERGEKLKLEKEKAEQMKLDKEKEVREKERLEKETLERERVEKLKLEEIEKIRLEKEKEEKERLRKDKLEILRLETEMEEKLKLEKEKAEQIKLKQEKLESKKESLENKQEETGKLDPVKEEESKLEWERTYRLRFEKDFDESQRLRLEEEKSTSTKKQAEGLLLDEKLISKRGISDQKRREIDKTNFVVVETKMQEEISKEVALEQEIDEEGDSRNSSSYSTLLSEKHEEMRQQWLKQYMEMRSRSEVYSWQEAKKPKSRISRPKKSLETFPELDVDNVLNGLPEGVTPSSCECVAVCGLGKIRMKGAQKFSRLRLIKMANCELEAVECIEFCDSLEKLDLPRNKIDTMCLTFHASLKHVSLAGNMLSSTTGLEQLVNLEVLDLSSNRITRIGSISSCTKLQRLNLSDNQLISLKGLEELHSLTSLEAARNHLGSGKEVENLSLLTRLDLHSNTINKIMELKNHVLVRELDLHENNISSLAPLENAWLPSLQHLNVAGNSIDTVPALDHLIMLSTLDLQDNVVRQSSSLLPGLLNCKRLTTLKISGNPVSDIPNLKSTLAKEISSLQFLDDAKLKDVPNETGCPNKFVELCVEQCKSHERFLEVYQQMFRNLDRTQNPYYYELEKLEIENKERVELFKLLVDGLQQHVNYGQTQPSDNQNEQPKINQSRDQGLQVDNEVKHSPDDVTVMREQPVEIDTNQIYSEVCDVIPDHKESNVEVVEKPDSEAAKIFSAEDQLAATKIQAVYRGYRIRRVLSFALESIRDSLAKASDDEDDFNYDEEVDLNEFDFDEGQEWRPMSTSQLPPRNPVFSATGDDTIKKEIEPKDAPKHAWQSFPRTPEGRIVEPLNLEMSPEESDRSSTVAETVLSRKKEEILTEWGFQNSATAELMMKRMKKMNTSGRKKNFLGIAPSKRYELFKKLQQAKPNLTVRPPSKKRTPNRVEYFSAQREIGSPSNMSNASSEKDFKKDMTYSWVCSQAVLHTDAYDDIMFDQGQSGDSATRHSAKSKDQVTLPYLDPAIIAGKPLPLVLMSSNALANPTLAAASDSRKRTERGEQTRNKDKSQSAPNPTIRTAPVWHANESSSSFRSSSSENRRRKKKA